MYREKLRMSIENREEWCGACAQREGEHALKEVSTKGASSLQYVEKGGGIIEEGK